MSGLLTGNISPVTINTANLADNAVTEAKVKDAFVGDFTEVTIAAGDSILLGDADDSGNTKRDTVQGLLDLVSSDMVLLSTQTASSSSSLDFTAFDNATYSSYIFQAENIGPGSDNTYLALRTSTDGGSTYDATAGHYRYGNSGRDDSGTASHTSNTSADELIVMGAGSGAGNAANEHINGTIWCHRPAGAEYTQFTSLMVYGSTATTVYYSHGAGWRASAADVDAVRFKMNSGNIADGRIKMYGIK